MEILSLPENEPFITGIEESIDICSNQIMKLADASIFHCRSGKAHIEIDLQAYEVTENTQLLLLPGSIFNCTCASHDFTVSYIVFSDTLFREITSRLDPSFFHFLKEHPCIVIPEERVKPFIGLSLVMKDLYEDRDNSFRIQIFKNFIQNHRCNSNPHKYNTAQFCTKPIQLGRFICIAGFPLFRQLPYHFRFQKCKNADCDKHNTPDHTPNHNSPSSHTYFPARPQSPAHRIPQNRSIINQKYPENPLWNY